MIAAYALAITSIATASLAEGAAAVNVPQPTLMEIERGENNISSILSQKQASDGRLPLKGHADATLTSTTQQQHLLVQRKMAKKGTKKKQPQSQQLQRTGTTTPYYQATTVAEHNHHKKKKTSSSHSNQEESATAQSFMTGFHQAWSLQQQQANTNNNGNNNNNENVLNNMQLNYGGGGKNTNRIRKPTNNNRKPSNNNNKNKKNTNLDRTITKNGQTTITGTRRNGEEGITIMVIGQMLGNLLLLHPLVMIIGLAAVAVVGDHPPVMVASLARILLPLVANLAKIPMAIVEVNLEKLVVAVAMVEALAIGVAAHMMMMMMTTTGIHLAKIVHVPMYLHRRQRNEAKTRRTKSHPAMPTTSGLVERSWHIKSHLVEVNLTGDGMEDNDVCKPAVANLARLPLLVQHPQATMAVI